MLTGLFPLYSVNGRFHKAFRKLVENNDCFDSGYFDRCPMRNMYIIAHRLRIHNSMVVNGESGILKTIPSNANYNDTLYEQAALGWIIWTALSKL